ncbi:hypothetical protein TEA_005968 [Camellia sinensis var. sinensis]|uniref:DAGKc domain-containing protein n=1 Tax=Camellia sinensis var. sinensis TaxID=542762 RepID=A0A4S4D8Y5_CAMSN|nr:hypothetical protein TEA_005968 [Camellia sinensis var. sinensis]
MNLSIERSIGNQNQQNEIEELSSQIATLVGKVQCLQLHSKGSNGSKDHQLDDFFHALHRCRSCSTGLNSEWNDTVKDLVFPEFHGSYNQDVFEESFGLVGKEMAKKRLEWKKMRKELMDHLLPSNHMPPLLVEKQPKKGISNSGHQYQSGFAIGQPFYDYVQVGYSTSAGMQETCDDGCHHKILFSDEVVEPRYNEEEASIFGEEDMEENCGNKQDCCQAHSICDEDIPIFDQDVEEDYGQDVAIFDDYSEPLAYEEADICEYEEEVDSQGVLEDEERFVDETSFALTSLPMKEVIAIPPSILYLHSKKIMMESHDIEVSWVLNGLLSRDNQKEAISIPIGIIPAGSDNSLIWTVLGVRDPISAAIAIVKSDFFCRGTWRSSSNAILGGMFCALYSSKEADTTVVLPEGGAGGTSAATDDLVRLVLTEAGIMAAKLHRREIEKLGDAVHGGGNEKLMGLGAAWVRSSLAVGAWMSIWPTTEEHSPRNNQGHNPLHVRSTPTGRSSSNFDSKSKFRISKSIARAKHPYWVLLKLRF